MRAVVQRVLNAHVESEGAPSGAIASGLMVLLGVECGDTDADAKYMAGKIVKLRIFDDAEGKMNLSVRDVGGQVLCVSQFTLLGDARGQNRPGFTRAERPEEADRLYELTCREMEQLGVHTEKGVFRTHMTVSLCNDGPVTILLDSRKNF